MTQNLWLFLSSKSEECVNMGSLGISEISRPSGSQDKHFIRGGHDQARTRCLEPLAYSGSLDEYYYHELTTAIGREFDGLQVVDLLESAQSDQLIRDLAITGYDIFYTISQVSDTH